MTQTHVKMEGAVPGERKIANVLFVHVKKIGQEKHVNKVKYGKSIFNHKVSFDVWTEAELVALEVIKSLHTSWACPKFKGLNHKTVTVAMLFSSAG